MVSGVVHVNGAYYTTVGEGHVVMLVTNVAAGIVVDNSLSNTLSVSDKMISESRVCLIVPKAASGTSMRNDPYSPHFLQPDLSGVIYNFLNSKAPDPIRNN